MPNSSPKVMSKPSVVGVGKKIAALWKARKEARMTNRILKAAAEAAARRKAGQEKLLSSEEAHRRLSAVRQRRKDARKGIAPK
jgi:hypothetical protein